MKQFRRRKISIAFKCDKCGYQTDEEITLCPTCSEGDESKKNIFLQFKGFVDASTEFVSTKGNELLDKNPKVREHAKKISEVASKKYVETGAKQQVDAVITKSGEKLDVISGKAMYDLVQERLALQDRYNDLLAMKLHEALERISELEEMLSELTSRNTKIK